MSKSDLAHQNLVTEMMIHFSNTGDIIKTLEWGLPRILKSIDAEAGSLFLHHAASKKLECAVCVGPVNIKGLSILDHQGIVGSVFQTKKGQLVADAEQDKNHHRAVDEKTGFKTKSIVTVPVFFGEEIYGSLQAINRLGKDGAIEKFDETHLGAFESVAITLGFALKNIRLTEKIVLDKLLEKDIKDAEEAQGYLFPKRDQYPFISGGVLPYRALSGDFVDYFEVNGKIAFIEGDVSGKGMPAAILMARCISLFRLFAKDQSSADEMAKNINAEIFAHGAGDRFATCVIGWYEAKLNTVSLVNCGHNPILYVSENDSKVFDSTAPPLGVSGNLEFKPQLVTLPLKHNDALYIVTDGITEALMGASELGMEGLLKIARRQNEMAPALRLEQLLNFIRQGKLTTHDDATLLVIRHSVNN
jgi:sigma-B regulation protein RsbU (phosphoserine phosphatase)